MKTYTRTTTNGAPRKAFVLVERLILSVAMTLVALVVERRLIKAIKNTA
ncbi:MAG TPA: hypothetical protein VF972_01535 [Actinomycetota bacterium]